MGLFSLRTNESAIRATRHLRKSQTKLNRSIRNLSSGYNINRAGDDSSDLAISEKMKAQITALGTLTDNCEDGVSFLQTAEGYMAEIHDMLNRMVELAEKSANGINEDSGLTGAAAYGSTLNAETGNTVVQNAGTDRAALQAEMDQLAAEIDRIALTANFNGNKLMNGNLDAANGGKASVAKADGTGWATLADNKTQFGKALTLQIGETAHRSDKLTVSIRRMTTDNLFRALTTTVTYDKADGSGKYQASLTIANGTTGANTVLIGEATVVKAGNASSWISGVTINISDQAMASKAATMIRDAINEVSLQRSQLGALQNRLDYTINNLDTTKENMESANSRIRDTDMAKEMMKFTQSNVLQQAAQAMLAQANTQPQNVLQLLQ